MANIIILGEGRNKQYKVMYELPRSISGERKRRSKTFPVGTSKSIIDEFKRQKEIELATGEMQTEKNITLTDFVENTYFIDCVKFLSPTTVAGYKRLYESKKPYCIKAYFGKHKIRDINRKQIQKYVNYLSDYVSPKTVRSYKMWLHTIFDFAITYDILKPGTNPTEYIKLPPKKKPPIEAYTVEQVQELLLYSQDDKISHLVISLGTMAGLRRGEMAGLRWENVTLEEDNAELKIINTRVVVDDVIYDKCPKTNAGIRTIPIPTTLANILKAEKTEYMKNKLRLGKDFADEGFVFSKEDGTPYRPDGLSIHYERFMYRMESDYGIPYKSLHKLRHTYATMLIDGGANPKVVQKNLGHEDVSMTLGTYAHAYDSRRRKEVDKLDIMLACKSS